MHSKWLVLLSVAGVSIASCSDDDDGDGGSGASNSGGTSGAANSGGKTQAGGTGGRVGTGGAGNGGSSTGTGGVGNGGSSGGVAPIAGASAGGDDGVDGGGAPNTDGGTPGASGAPETGGSGGAAPTASTCVFPAAAALADAALPEGFCAWNFAIGIGKARGITIDAEGNALVVSSAKNEVVALWDDDGDGVSGDGERAIVASAPGLNHGIAIHDGYLYASSVTTVYRWSYAADRQPLGAATTVVNAIPSGGHSTRSLALDDDYLYVTVGSGGNLDANSERARIRRFPIEELDDNPAFAEGEVFADGLRNEVGIRFDSSGRLWGVENGRDNLERDDLGGDIHQDNPAEELNLFAEAGKFYGYPYCFSEYALADGVGMGPGTQWADPEFIDDGTHTDAWCQDASNVVPPALSMQGHSAPLDLIFYPGGSFPGSFTGDLFVSFHGSWNRTQATGYKVMHIPFGSDGMPSGDPVPLLESSGAADDDWGHRPVGLGVLPNGILLVTSDESSRVLAVGYEAP